MQKPKSVTWIQVLLYVNVVLLLLYFVLGIAMSGPSGLTVTDFSNMSLSFLIPLASLYLAQRFISSKKFVPALLCSIIVILMTFVFPALQLLFALIILMLYFLVSTRDYFKREYREPSVIDQTHASDAAADGTPEDQVKALPPVEPTTREKHHPDIEIREAGPGDAEKIHALMMAAFEEYRAAVPPSSALEETVESIRQALADGRESAAILYEDDKASAMVRFRMEFDVIVFFRLSVVPARRRRGYAKKLIQWIEHRGVSKGMLISRCKVRQSVQNNVILYQDRGYEIVNQELVVRPEGTVKTLTMEKKLVPV